MWKVWTWTCNLAKHDVSSLRQHPLNAIAISHKNANHFGEAKQIMAMAGALFVSDFVLEEVLLLSEPQS
jgi:hypothetical protein